MTASVDKLFAKHFQLDSLINSLNNEQIDIFCNEYKYFILADFFYSIFNFTKKSNK